MKLCDVCVTQHAFDVTTCSFVVFMHTDLYIIHVILNKKQ